MRKLVIVSIALSGVTLGAVASAQIDPRERFERVRQAVKPAPQKPSNNAPIQDQGVHNAVHAAHQNQIVFTRIDTSVSGITEADIVSDFTLGQPMFFRVYTEKSAVNAIAAANNLPARQVYADGVHYSARFTIGGQVFDTVIFPWGNPTDHETWTTWRGQFINPNKFGRVPGSDAFLEMLSRATGAGLLKPGKHSVRMELIAKTNTENAGPISAGTVATGTFNLTVPAGVFQANNPGVCGPVRGGVSPTIEARALAQAKQYWDKPDLTPVKAVAIGGEWTIEKNELTSIPIERFTYVSIVSRGAKYCTSQGHKFTEKYAGGGTYSAGGISVNYTPGYVPCACLG